MKLAYDLYKSIILIDSTLTKDVFLAYTGAKSGYSFDMFSRMYDAITSELIDLERQFKEYYEFEYLALERFLYKKYNIDREDIDKMMEEKRINPNCIIYKKKDHAYGESGLDELAFSETMYERITAILLQKTDGNEN